jgi:hypothetical protein
VTGSTANRLLKFAPTSDLPLQRSQADDGIWPDPRVVGRDAPLHQIGAVGDELFDNHRLARIKRDFEREMVSDLKIARHRALLPDVSPTVSDSSVDGSQGRGPRGAGSMLMAAWAVPPHRETAWIEGATSVMRPLQTGGVRQRSARIAHPAGSLGDQNRSSSRFGAAASAKLLSKRIKALRWTVS